MTTQLSLDPTTGPRTGDRKLDRMLDELESTWAGFHASYAGLADDDLLIQGVCGPWSIRDLIAHVTWWDNEALDHLPAVLAGSSPPKYSETWGGIDAFNAKMTARDANLSLEEVRARAAATHETLETFVRQVEPAALTPKSRFRHRLKLDSFGHYPIHTAQILAWRDLRCI